MSSEQGRWRRAWIWGAVTVGAVGAVALLATKDRRKDPPPSFQYDIAEHEKVDPALVIFEETAKIPFEAGDVRALAATPDVEARIADVLERRDPFVRRLNAKLFGGFLVRILLNVHVKDLNCAFKLIPKKVLDSITLESTGALINAELYGRSVRRGFGIREVGVHHYPRTAGVQTGAHLGVIIRAFYDLFRLWWKIISEK